MKIKQKTLRGPLLCWDIYASGLAKNAIEFNRQTELDILKSFKKKFKWQLDIDAVFQEKDFEALVLTDCSQSIKWVNKGFTKMTGYPVNFAIGKKPGFLQGAETSTKTKKNISANLKTGKPFKERIINYKKDGALYYCEIEIFPLKSNSNKTTHFLAFEKEVGV